MHARVCSAGRHHTDLACTPVRASPPFVLGGADANVFAVSSAVALASIVCAVTRWEDVWPQLQHTSLLRSRFAADGWPHVFDMRYLVTSVLKQQVGVIDAGT